jgi:hypothetical protein
MGMFSFHLTPWRNFCSGFSTMGELLLDGLQFLRTISHSRAALAAEILFLRKQVAYYQDHRIRPRRLRDASRLCLLFWSRLFDWPAALVIVKASFLRWHRKGFKWYWRWKSRGGRPPLPKAIRQLIAHMVRENVTWGEERIANELSLKLGIYVSPRTIRKYWPQQPGMGSGRRRSASQHWKTFVRNHAQEIVACDFLVAVTARFRILFLRLYRSKKGVNKTIKTLVSRHRPASSPTMLSVDDLTRLASAIASGKLGPVSLVVTNAHGRAVFVTEDLFRTLGTQKELALICASNSP